ncbi:MAG: DNA polymerase III subunit delta [Aerococcus sp.]|nr:DNA polymerase III subunit delta [Aerococcus sp.]
MDFRAAVEAIHQEKIAPIYLLLGTENYLIQSFRDTMITHIIGSSDDADDMNLMTFDLEETPLDDVMVEANTLSFFSGRRMIWAKNAAFLTGSQSKTNTEELLAYLDAPNPDVTLCFTAPYEKLDKRKKIVKRMLKDTTVVDVSPVKQNEIERYIKAYVANEAKQIAPQTMKLFLERTGYELSHAMHEIEKLCLYVGDGSEITAEDVRAVIPPSLDDNIFNLATYIIERKTSDAIRLYRTLVAERQQPIAILALLLSEFRLYTQINLLKKQGYGQNEMARTLQSHPYRIKMAMKKTARYETSQFMAAYQSLVRLDYRIKTGRVEPDFGIEQFILQFTQAQPIRYRR